jgi:transcriptional regulator with XRE-family HTH domain
MKGVLSRSDKVGVKELGKRIKELREEKRYSKAQLAKALGLAHVQLGKYERGESAPTHETLKKIANLLEVSTDYFLSKTNQPSQEFHLEKWVETAKSVLSKNDQLKIAEYIQLLCMRAESKKMVETYHD